MIRGIFSFRFWLLVCAFAVPGSLALAQCSKIYNFDWTGPVETYQVKMSGTVQVTWNPTARTVTFVTSVSGQGKNPSGDWVSTGASVKLTGLTLQGGARIGSSTIYNGYTLTNGTTVITILAGYSPSFETACQANTWSGGIKSSGVNGAIDMTNLTQAAAAAPNPLIISAGQSGDVVFSGAIEDGRATKWQVELVSGSIEFTVDQGANMATFTGGSPGVVQLRVRATPAACAPASDWTLFSVEVAVTYCATIKLDFGATATSAPYNFKASYYDGNPANPIQLLTEWTIPAGTTGVYMRNFGPLENPGFIYIHQLKYIVHVYDEHTGSWWKPVGGVVTVAGDWDFVGSVQLENCYGTITPKPIEEAAPTPGKPNPTDPNGPPVPATPGSTPTTAPSAPSTGAGGKLVTGPLWSSAPSDGPLTDKTFKEGVNSIVSELNALNSKTDGTGSGGDPNGAAIGEAAGAGAGATDGEGTGNGAGEASGDVADAMDGGPATPSLSLPSGSASGLSIVGAYGVNINLNPASNPLVSSLADFLKQVVTWLAGLGFAWWCWGEFDRAVRHLLHAEQAKGNAIIGGTGGQATALIAAGAITALLIAVPLAFWAFATYDITPVSNPSGPGSIALYLLFFFLPVPYLLSLVTAAFVVRKAALVLVAATATLIRFVVP